MFEEWGGAAVLVLIGGVIGFIVCLGVEYLIGIVIWNFCDVNVKPTRPVPDQKMHPVWSLIAAWLYADSSC